MKTQTAASFIKYAAQMTVGWLCFWLFMAAPDLILDNEYFHDLILPHAGFYAYDTGFEDHIRRKNEL